MKRILLAIVVMLLSSAAGFAQAPAGFTKLANTSALTFTDAGCPNLTTCYYVVTAVDSAGFESLPAACATNQLCVNGNIAVAQMPSSGTHTVALTWNASTTTGVTYNAYVHIGPFAPSGIGAKVN